MDRPAIRGILRTPREARAVGPRLRSQQESFPLPMVATPKAQFAYLLRPAASSASSRRLTECPAAEIDDVAKVSGHAVGRKLFEASTWFLRQVGHAFSAVKYEQARTAIGGMSRAIGDFFTKYDVVMTPTLAYPPAQIGEFELKAMERAGIAIVCRCGPNDVLKRVLFKLAARTTERTANTMLFNMTGQPAMSVPLWWNAEGMPIGVQFGGRFGGEATLLRLASPLQHQTPWAN